MANNKIKGLTVEIGGDTTKLGQALDNVDKKTRNLSSELNQINKLLRLDPSNTELLAQKQKVLSEAIANTRDRLETLKKAEADVQAQFERGEVSEEQVRALQREIIATEGQLKKYEQAAEETAKQTEELGKSADGAEDQLDKLGDTADDTGENVDELDRKVNDLAKKGLVALTAAVGAAVAGLAKLSFGTAEFADEVLTQSQVTGIATDQLQEMRYAAELVDVSVDTLTGSMAKQIRSMSSARDGSEATSEAYKKLGISVVGANGELRDSQDVFWEVIDSLGRIENETERDALAMQLLGRSAQDLNPLIKAGSGRMRELAKEAHDLGYVLDQETLESFGELDDSVQRFRNTADATGKKLGKALLPVLKSLTEEATDFLKSTDKPLKDTVKFISGTVVPTIVNGAKLFIQNFDKIVAVVTGAGAAMLAYKAAVFVATTAQVGLTGALQASTVAQNALNFAQNANPYGLLAAGIAAVVAGLAAYAIITENSKEKTDILTEAERELIEAANEARDAFNDQMDAYNQTADTIMSNSKHNEALAKELLNLADASGRVKESDQARANFILGELSKATGEEYKMVDGVIQSYDTLKDSIFEVLKAKQANLLLEAQQQAYTTALQNREKALQALTLSEKDYQNQVNIVYEQAEKVGNARMELDKKIAAAKTESEKRQLASEGERVAEMERNLEKEKNLLAEKQDAYDQALSDYATYSDTINGYEEAQTAAMQGNYERVTDILTKKKTAFLDYADTVDSATAEAVDDLYQEAVDAGLAAKRTKENFEKGVDGYTEEMVKEAEKGYEDAMNAFADAYEAANGVGEDIGSGMAQGLENKRNSLLTKIRSIVSAIFGAARNEADSHSPSRKMIKVFEDIGEGGVVGLENETKDIEKAARDQVKGVLDAYSGESDLGQATYRAISNQATARQTAVSQKTSAETSSKLDRIIQALEDGKILTIDGAKFVGATANLYDTALGQKRLLTERGAL